MYSGTEKALSRHSTGMQADIDALASMIAATAQMAERARNDAVSHLLQRALAALPRVPASDASGTEPSEGQAATFSRR